MARFQIMVLSALLLAGCDGGSTRMEHAEDPQGRYHDQIAAAKRLLEQKENWSDRAEWEVSKSGDGWKVTAWRVEHPQATGADRYLPWGYSEIDLDRRIVPVGYHRKG